MKHRYQDDEYQLYQDCRQGLALAQEWLYHSCFPMVSAVCRRYVVHLPDAEEVVADSFIRFFEALQKEYRYAGPGSLSAYLKKIALNQSLMFLRKQQLSFEDIDGQEEQWPDVDLNALHHMAARDVLALVQELPPGYRTVFNMYVVEGYSHPEIAAALQISVATSKTQLMKAKLQLQQKLRVYERSI